MSKPNMRTKPKKGAKQSHNRIAPGQIAKSKQLILKKASSPKNRNTKRLKKKLQSNNHCCELPTLADLERMFEDNDSDVGDPAPASPKTLNANKTILCSKEKTNTTTGNEILCITENIPIKDLNMENTTSMASESNCIVIDCDSDYLSDDLSAERPRKKQKIEEKTSSQRQAIISKMTEPQVESSNDSDVTIAYEIDILTPQRFSPLPSTSRDNDTISKNEMRFSASFLSDVKLKKSPKHMSETIKDVGKSLETAMKPLKKETINRTSLETIIIDDEEDNSIIVYNNAKNNLNRLSPPTLIHDDCIACVDDQKDSQMPSSPIVMDEEYNIITINDETTININDLSIDDIIAENTNIINKYSDIPSVTVTEIPPMQTKINNSNTQLNTNRPATNEPNSDVITSDIQIVSTNRNSENELPNERINQNSPSFCPVGFIESPNERIYLNSPSLSPVGFIESSANNVQISHYENEILYNRRKRKRKTNNSLNVHSSRRLENENTNTSLQMHSNSEIRPETHNTSPLSNKPSTSTQVSTSGRNIGDCPICLDPLSAKAICSTICGHIFCMECINIAVRTSKRCPACRKILKKNGFHPIFL